MAGGSEPVGRVGGWGLLTAKRRGSGNRTPLQKTMSTVLQERRRRSLSHSLFRLPPSLLPFLLIVLPPLSLCLIGVSAATSGPALGSASEIGRVEELEKELLQETVLSSAVEQPPAPALAGQQTAVETNIAEHPEAANITESATTVNTSKAFSTAAITTEASNAQAPGASAWDTAAFLESYWEFPGPEVCGQWGNTYPALHRDIRSGRRKPARYLRVTLRGIGGLGDRLVGLVSAFTTALLTSRAFIVDDPDLLLAFEPGQVDWKPGEDVPPPLPPSERRLPKDPRRGFSMEGSQQYVEARFFNGPRPGDGVDAYSQVSFPQDILSAFAPYENVSHIHVLTNGGVLISILSASAPNPSAQKLQSMGLRIPTAYACILRFLLRPKKEVWMPLAQKLKELKPRPQSVSLCSHLRIGDGTFLGSRANRETLSGVGRLKAAETLGCIKNVLAGLPVPSETKASVKVLFLSEKPAVRGFVQQALGKMVVVSDVYPRHFIFDARGSKEQIRSTVISTIQDWLLFSLCNFYIVPVSGFSRTSMAYSLMRQEVFTDPSSKSSFPGYGRCNASRSDSLSIVAKTWSGL